MAGLPLFSVTASSANHSANALPPPAATAFENCPSNSSSCKAPGLSVGCASGLMTELDDCASDPNPGAELMPPGLVCAASGRTRKEAANTQKTVPNSE